MPGPYGLVTVGERIILNTSLHNQIAVCRYHSYMPPGSFALFPLTRRGFFLGGAAALVCAKGIGETPSCALTPEQETGPYYIDYEQLRPDVSEGKPGVPLKLRIALVDSKSCAPLNSAAVDIWHCDASGVYSGFAAESAGGRGPGRGGPGGMPPPSRGPGGPGGGPPPGR